ncbi:WD40/YVTN/BNR-like repeat-containing protein [Phytoactinopolyspora halotolerans]|uniref:Exo-alpha-sialidase n=1 Tax=Phytoactinopolyspora halotolerans TaxID=1981512 RepID=A0A6L9SH66_9ACTN|nr:exo-alpha-sialidase [Phytoactinopolyspora halotolerans]NEE03762.1 exo-alpha-sialidase [Phytoactinopolyspora halotolerans]
MTADAAPAPITLLVGTTKGGFVVTSDHGRTRWRRRGPLFPGWQVNDMFRIPGTGRMLAATSHLAYGATVRASDDDGETWRQQGSSPRYAADAGRTVQAVWRFASGAPSSGVVYTGVSDGGLFASRDAGRSWAEITALSEHPTRPHWAPAASGSSVLHSIVVDGDRIWVAVSHAGVFRSDDGGESWRPCNDGLPAPPMGSARTDVGHRVHKLVAHPGPPHTLYLQGFEGTFCSTDGAETWLRIDDGLPSSHGFPIAVDHTGTVWVAPLAGADERYMPEGRLAVYRTPDAGGTWMESRHGMPDEPQYVGVLRDALTTDACDPVGVYVGTTSGEVYASADAGRSWQQLPGRMTRITSIRAVTTIAAVTSSREATQP